MRPIRSPGSATGCATPGSSSTSGTSGLGEPLPEDLEGYDGLVVLGGPQSALDDEATSPELVRVRDLLSAGARRRLPHAGDLPRRPAARPGGRRDGAPGHRRPGGGRDPASPSGTPPTPTRCSVRCRSRRTCCSSTTTRSPSCRPGRRCWPATPSTPTRPSAWAGTSTGCSSTSRRRRRSCTSGPSATSSAWRPARTTGRPSACSPTPPIPTSPRRGRRSPARFADLVRARARAAA